MRTSTKRMVTFGMILAGAGTVCVLAQQTSGPVARYEMRAETMSGFGAGGKGGMASAMSMAFGGAPKAQHALWLDLGSTRAAADAKPKADHFLPSGAKLGKSVALKTPVKTVTAKEPGTTDFQRPKGRMLIFWGCGEHAPKGQPVVIDFSKLAAGQVPPGLFSSAVPMDRWVSPSSSKTYGHWPSDDGKSAKPDTSLIGAHRVVGNYSPDMAFTLAKDFMAPLNATNTVQKSGSTLVKWGAVPDATGYYAMVIGGKQAASGQDMADIMWWSSSATRQFGGGLSDWLAPATVARLVTAKTVMSPQTTTCTIPAEVKAAAPDYMFGTLNAYGPEESFAYPPKPADPKAKWVLEWTARIRHRSSTGFLVGVEGFGGGQAETADTPQCKPKKKGFGGLLGGAIGGALGVPVAGDGC